MKKRIIILISIIILLLLSSVIAIVCMQKDGESIALKAELYRDNELLQEIDLSVVGEPYQIKIEYTDENGKDGYNIVEVRHGEIAIMEASCPDKLCVKMGAIHNANMPITCLPNHLVIRIVETGDSNYDGFAY